MHQVSLYLINRKVRKPAPLNGRELNCAVECDVHDSTTASIASLSPTNTAYAYTRNDGEEMAFNDLKPDVALDIMMQDLDRSLDMNIITDSKMLSCKSRLLLSNARAILHTTKGIYERVLSEIMAERKESKLRSSIKTFVS